jgi:formylglycine-generating enzyme required for sulfatase activity
MELVLLPIRPDRKFALAISKYPITNAQYKDFMVASNYDAPTGKTFKAGKWSGPFAPLEHPEFNNPKQPVVCVDFRDAVSYCCWVNRALNVKGIKQTWKRQVFLPLVELWDLAAFGLEPSHYVSELIFSEQQSVHYNSDKPAMIDESGGRSNKRGISDMFGNIWEWCIRRFHDEFAFIAIDESEGYVGVELRGGSFLDDLRKFKGHD